MSDPLRESIHHTAEKIGERLLLKQSKVSTAESCTGGTVASSLCAVPGASQWFDTGIVAYTYESKSRQIGISKEILDKGLVTQATAEAMAKRMLRISGSDYVIATTGVCGPSESEGHAPCHVWVAIGLPTGAQSRLITAEDRGREGNILFVTMSALNFLLENLY